MEWTPAKTLTRTVVTLMMGVIWLPAVVITIIGLVLLGGSGRSAEIGVSLVILGGITVVVLPGVLVMFARKWAAISRQQVAQYEEAIAARAQQSPGGGTPQA